MRALPSTSETCILRCIELDVQYVHECKSTYRFKLILFHSHIKRVLPGKVLLKAHAADQYAPEEMHRLTCFDPSIILTTCDASIHSSYMSSSSPFSTTPGAGFKSIPEEKTTTSLASDFTQSPP